MPHRAPDTRLLTTLLASTSTLQKALSQFHQTHLSHITCLTAYASSSAPPTSSLLLSTSSLLARCIEQGLVLKLDSALESWMKALSHLKEVEEEVGRIGRDREILIGRVIKAGQKAAGVSSKRDSTLGSSVGSTSTLSLGSGPLTPTGEKLNQAQLELQACEAALINKEKELTVLRAAAINESLAIQFQGLIECAAVFNELGAEGITLIQSASDFSVTSALSSPTSTPGPPSPTNRPSSEASSLTPSQSASQVASHIPSLHSYTPSPLSQPEGAHIYSDAEIKHYRKNSEGGFDSIATPQSQASSTFSHDRHIPILSTTPATPPESARVSSKHTLPRRITEESLAQGQPIDESDSDNDGLQELQVVENPRFAPPEKSKQKSTSQIHLPVGRVQGENESNVSASTHLSEATSNRKKPNSGFFGTIRSIFGQKDKDGSHNNTRDTSPTKSRFGGTTPSSEKKHNKEKRKTTQALFPSSPSSSALATSSAVNGPIGLGIGLPPGETKQRKRVTSDLTGSRKLKRRVTEPHRSASGSRSRAGDDFGGLKGKATNSNQQEELPPAVPPVDLGLIHQRERRVSMDRESVKGWVDSVSAASGSRPTSPAQKAKVAEVGDRSGYASDSVSTPKPPKKKRIGKAATTKTSAVDGEDSVLSAPPTLPASTFRQASVGGAPVARKSSLKKANTLVLPANGSSTSLPGKKAKIDRHASLPPPPRPSSTGYASHSPETKPSAHATPASVHPYHQNLKHSKNDLMSIVEAVHTSQPVPSSAPGHRRSSSHQTAPNVAGNIMIPKAPPPMGRAELEDLVSGKDQSKHVPLVSAPDPGHTEEEGPFAIPRAPGSVFNAPAAWSPPPSTSAPLGRASTESRRSNTPSVPLKSALKAPSPPPQPTRTTALPPLFPPQEAIPRANGTSKIHQTRPISTLSTESTSSMDSFYSAEDSGDYDENGDATITTGDILTHAEPGLTVDDGASTISQASTETNTAPPPPPQKTPSPPIQSPEPPVTPRISTDASENDVKTTRRKSVRVSLQPTFSTTPPALEDWQSPWASASSENDGNARPSYPDVWQDSSDEDEEYVQARRLLSR